MQNTEITLQARIQTSRATGPKRIFLQLRQQTHTVQALLSVNEKISKQMLKFVAGISPESLVLIEATVVATETPVKSCTIQSLELSINTIRLVSAADRLPFTLEDATRSETEFELNPTLARVHIDTRLNNRVIDLRTITNQAIFRLQGAIVILFREYLDSKGFLEIHSPKLIGAASEGGSNVFTVSYFKSKIILT